MVKLSDQIERLRVIRALRIALVMVACIALAVLLDMQSGVFAIFPVLVISFMFHDESPVAGLSLVAGAALGAAISYVTIDLFLTARPLFMLVTLMVICLLGYWAAQGFRRRWPGAFGAFFAILIVAGAAFAAISGAQLGERIAFQWTMEIALGVVVTWVIMLGLWPSPAARELDDLCSGIAQECAVLLNKTADRLEAGQMMSYHPSPVSLMNFGKWRHQVDTLNWRFRGKRQHYEAIRQRMRNLLLAYVNVRHMERTLADLPQGADVADIRAEITVVLRGLADGMEHPAETSDLEPTLLLTDRRCTEIAQKLQQADAEMKWLPAKLAAFTTAARELQGDIMTLAHPELSEAPLSSEAEPAGSTIRIEQDSAKSALKLTLGVAIALLLHLIPFMPAGAYLVLGLVVVMVQPNLGKSHLRVRLWFPGVLAGSVYSLVGLAMISFAPHLPLLLAWLAAGFLIGAYIGAGNDRISYSGFQICVGITVILGVAAFPLSTVIAAEERIFGAILGFVVALAVGQNLWPEHPADLLRKSFAENLRAIPPTLSRLCAAEDPDPALLNSYVQRLQTDVHTDFALLYDFSYMLPGKIRAAYDYRWMTHATGNMFHQIWTLHQALSRVEDPEIKRAMIDPTTGALDQLRLLIDALANEIETGGKTAGRTIQARLQALDAAIEDAELLPVAAGEMQRARFFGINFIREMSRQLALVISSVDRQDVPVMPETSQLAHTYEGGR